MKSLLDNLKSMKVKIKCERCKGYLHVPAIRLEQISLNCRCGGSFSPIDTLHTWTYKGYNCEIKRNNYFGSYLGYVDIPRGHILYGKYHDEIDIRVHGGLTYSDWNGEYWRIGFDTIHPFDYIPIYQGLAMEFVALELGKMNIWTLEGVIEEVEQMVEQIDDQCYNSNKVM